MKKFKLPLLAIVIASLSSCHSENNQEMKWQQLSVEYPTTEQRDSVSTFFGEEVPDPYRWLENDMSEETANWVERQNKVTFGYLDQIPFRSNIQDHLTQIWNYEKRSAPFKRGSWTYFYKNDGLQNQSVVYRRTSDQEAPEVFIDPNTFSKDGTTSLAGLSFTKDGSICSYMISEGGSDWRKVIVKDVESGEILEDTLVDVKFSGTSWLGNEGFYYSSYDKPKGSALSAKTQQHKLYFHKLGTPQSEDRLVFGGENARRYIGAGVTENQQFLVVSAANSTSGNELYIKRLPDGEIQQIAQGFEHDFNVVHAEDNAIYILTNLNAPNKQLLKLSAPGFDLNEAEVIIPENEMPLSVNSGSNSLFAVYMKDAISYIEQYTLGGELIRVVDLPGVGSAGGFSGKMEDSTLYYSFSSYINPSTIYKYNATDGSSEKHFQPEINFDPNEFESKQVFYTSKDGTKIPMIITHKKGLKLDGTNPTLLYGYGGFNVSITPSFSVSRIPWLENGGIWAVANLRGGGEYGRAWHDAGIKQKKQNVFDDFIAAGEYLITSKYTSPQKLAIKGGSNGGLLVGAVMTQRPDLMAVALPAVGVLDMLRYHTFTAGAGWAYDYGTAEDSPEMFKYLLNYSPVHNVKKGTEYPATLVTTGDHDDRVVPAHSHKFTSALQAAQTGTNPVLTRINVNAGHGAGKPTEMVIAEIADELAFTFWNMKYTSLPTYEEKETAK